MYIKSQEVKEDKVVFECSPVYDTHRLVNRARAIVDDYFTFVNFESMLEIHNFRKYSIAPLFEQFETRKRLYGVKVSELLYYDLPFSIDVLKNGKVIVYFPSGLADDERFSGSEKERDLFVDRFERGIKYVSISQ